VEACLLLHWLEIMKSKFKVSSTGIVWSVLQCVAVCCSVLQQTLHFTALFTVIVCSVLQCVAVCCSVLQCVAVDSTFHRIIYIIV